MELVCSQTGHAQGLDLVSWSGPRWNGLGPDRLISNTPHSGCTDRRAPGSRRREILHAPSSISGAVNAAVVRNVSLHLGNTRFMERGIEHASRGLGLLGKST